MATKPYQSKLIPYEEEIMKLRRRRPPTTYAHIADILQRKYNLVIHRSAICKFIKVRKGGRKVYGFYTKPAEKKSIQPAIQLHTATNPQIQQQKPRFEFTYSERYNLKRLPPEEAAIIRRKLEEEGH